MLPVAPADPHPLPAPEFAPSPHALPAAETLARPDYRFELDLVDDTVSCVLRPPDGGRTSKRLALHGVESESGAHGDHLVGNARRGAPDAGYSVEATCQTSSDETSYTHLSQVRITVDGAEHFNKSWSESVPRRLS